MDIWSLEEDYKRFCQQHGMDMTVAPEEQTCLSKPQARWLEAHMESRRQLVLAQMEGGQYRGYSQEGVLPSACIPGETLVRQQDRLSRSMALPH